MMNGLERFLAALEHREPDRVPVYELIINAPVIEKILGYVSLTDLVERLDMDGLTVGEDVKMREVAPGILRDEWGILYKVGTAGIYPIEGPIKTREDLEKLKPPNPEAPYRLKTLKSYVKRFKGERAIVFLGHDAFEFLHYLLGGLDKLLITYHRDPDFAIMLAEVVSEYKQRVLERAAEEGADVLLTGDDYATSAGPFMSPTMFRKFVLPYLSRAIRLAHSYGLPFIKHTDGNIWKILDMMVEAGIDGLHPIEPHAGMDIGEVKRRYGDKICLVGNVDCTSLLPMGTPEEVEEAVKETIAKAAPGGGYILSSSNSIHPGVKPENFLAMVKAARKYGKYPIDPQLIETYSKKNYMKKYLAHRRIKA